MSHETIHRFDLPIRVTADQGRVHMSWFWPRRAYDCDLTALLEWNRSGDFVILRQELRRRGLHTAIQLLIERQEKFRADEPASTKIPRLTLEIGTRELVAIRWEAVFGPLAPKEFRRPLLLVHTTEARPLVADALALPMRILHVDPPAQRALITRIKGVFGKHVPDARIRQALINGTRAASDLVDGSLPAGWPKADILHFNDPLHSIPEVVGDRRATLTSAGTIRQFERLVQRMQTRLIVLVGRGRSRNELLEFAWNLTRRGGPAVLVGPPSNQVLGKLYANLIHDFPLDQALEDIPGAELVLFAGGGREDALRVSAAGLELMELQRDLARRRSRVPDAILDALLEKALRVAASAYAPTSLITLQLPEDQLLKSLKPLTKEFAGNWADFVFRFRESDGLLPLSDEITKLRQTLAEAKVKLVLAKSAVFEQTVQRPERHVNTGFWHASGNGTLERIAQKGSWLKVGKLVHLGFQIAARDEKIRVIGATLLDESAFEWTPNKKGVWLEVAVTSPDFEVPAHAVRQIWLPRDQESVFLTFPVVPRRKGVATLRLSLFYENTLLLSQRIAARTFVRTKSPVPQARAELAAAIDVKPREVGAAGYLPRVDYNLGVPIDDAAAEPGRQVCILANRIGPTKQTAVKMGELFAVRINRDTSSMVQDVRTALSVVAAPTLVTHPKNKQHPYAFSLLGKVFRSDALLKRSLVRLAEPGWNLYDALIPASAREQLAVELASSTAPIQIAQALIEDVIPWAALYDRKFDAETSKAAHEGCLAPIDAEGKLQAMECGTHKDCPLHPDRQKSAKLKPVRDTVACPLHFWGFRHQIELPVQQVTGSHGKEQRIVRAVTASATPRLAIGFHPGLTRAQTHLDELVDKFEKQTKQIVVASRHADRDDLLESLKDLTLDLIYLFCHARGGRDVKDGPRQPKIEVKGFVGRSALDFDKPWPHHPLAILNGCNTAAFSPDAVSEFVTKLVNDRGAAGVIGTEIPVFEDLAAEFAIAFLDHFLSGMSAGQAILAVRQHLLQERNPLGLAYTLYGAADLTLVRPSK